MDFTSCGVVSLKTMGLIVAPSAFHPSRTCYTNNYTNKLAFSGILRYIWDSVRFSRTIWNQQRFFGIEFIVEFLTLILDRNFNEKRRYHDGVRSVRQEHRIVVTENDRVVLLTVFYVPDTLFVGELPFSYQHPSINDVATATSQSKLYSSLDNR